MVLNWAESKGGREEDESGVYLSNVSEEVTSDFVRTELGRFGEIKEVGSNTQPTVRWSVYSLTFFFFVGHA